MTETLIYFFYGTDDFRIRKEIEKIKLKNLNKEQTDFNFDKLENPSAYELLAIANSYPVFAAKRIIFIEDFDDKLLNDSSLLNYLKDPSPSTIIIFYKNSSKINENTGLLKELKQKKYFHLSKIRQLYNNELPRYIKNLCMEKDIEIGDEAVFYLLRLAGNNLVNIDNELNKLMAASKNKKAVTLKDIKDIVPFSRTFNVFDLIDSILEKDFKKAFNIFNLIYKEGEEPAKIVSILYTEIKKLHRAKLLESSGIDYNNILVINGIQNFLKNKFLKNMDGFSMRNLEKMIELLEDSDFKLKTSRFPGSLIIEDFIFKLRLIFT